MADEDDDDDNLVMETEVESEEDQDDGVTFVEEFSSGGGSVGGGFSGGGGSGSDGGTAGPDPGAGTPSGVVVDGATGEVVGTASVNPETGTAETSGVDVTVVEEQSDPPAGGSSGGTETQEPPVVTAPGDGATPDMGQTPHIDPALFRFHPVLPNEQETNCVPIFFAYRVNGVPATDPISVSSRFRAPRRLQDGTVITAREATLTAAHQSLEIALAVQEAVETGAINATEAPPLFRRLLTKNFQSQGQGFKVCQCFPPGGP